jgi:hypothetical protein
MPALSSGGRARSKVSFSTITASPAAAAELAAAAPARGSIRRHGVSQTAPTQAISGHFTHQADARTNSTVSGAQRMLSPKADTATSTLRIPSSTSCKAAGG